MARGNASVVNAARRRHALGRSGGSGPDGAVGRLNEGRKDPEGQDHDTDRTDMPV